MPLENRPPVHSALRTLLGYGLMIAATVALFFAIRAYGETVAAPAGQCWPPKAGQCCPKMQRPASGRPG